MNQIDQIATCLAEIGRPYADLDRLNCALIAYDRDANNKVYEISVSIHDNLFVKMLTKFLRLPPSYDAQCLNDIFIEMLARHANVEAKFVIIRDNENVPWINVIADSMCLQTNEHGDFSCDCDSVHIRLLGMWRLMNMHQDMTHKLLSCTN